MCSDLAQPGPRPTVGDAQLMLGAGGLAAFEQLVLRYQPEAWRVDRMVAADGRVT